MTDQFNIGRKFFGKGFNHRQVFLLCFRNIFSCFLCSGYQHTTVPVDPGDMFLFFIIESHIGHVLEVNDIAIAVEYNGVLNFFQAFIIPAGFYIKALGAGPYTTARYIGRFTLYITQYIVQRNFQPGQFIQLEVYADNLFRHAPVIHFLQALDFFQLFFQVIGIKLQALIRCVF